MSVNNNVKNTFEVSNVMNDQKLIEQMLKDGVGLKGLGLYFFLKNTPNYHAYTLQMMQEDLKTGTNMVRTAMKELKDAGYISYTKFSDGSGEYLLHTKPLN